MVHVLDQLFADCHDAVTKAKGERALHILDRRSIRSWEMLATMPRPTNKPASPSVFDVGGKPTLSPGHSRRTCLADFKD